MTALSDAVGAMILDRQEELLLAVDAAGLGAGVVEWAVLLKETPAYQAGARYSGMILFVRLVFSGLEDPEPPA